MTNARLIELLLTRNPLERVKIRTDSGETLEVTRIGDGLDYSHTEDRHKVITCIDVVEE